MRVSLMLSLLLIASYLVMILWHLIDGGCFRVLPRMTGITLACLMFITSQGSLE